MVFDRERRFVAVGLYDPHSPIRMRALACREPTSIDDAFLASRIERAIDRRSALEATSEQAQGTDAYRLVHGESDGLPGFVADRYADTVVVKLYSHAWIPHLGAWRDALLERTRAARLVLRLSRQLSARPAALEHAVDGSVIAGEPIRGPLYFRENGLRFEVDPLRGQKTGFFLDQRENRARVEAVARGRRVLNVFSYSGAFSLYAARGGAPEVWSLDRSPHALASAERNFALNRAHPSVAAARHVRAEGDAFQEMARLARRGERFGLVIVDPPSFATRRSQVEAASRSYGRLTQLALGLLDPGGRIVLASCSSAVAPEVFRDTVRAAAQGAGRPLRGVEEFAQPLDHPLDFAEGRYLKCVFARA